MQRLARAHANCVEGLPIFGGLSCSLAVLAGKSFHHGPAGVHVFLVRGILQSVIHLSSLSALGVLRFGARRSQCNMGIGVYWAFRLLVGKATR
jgi:hypothetical protein